MTDVYVPDYSIRIMGSFIKIALLMFFFRKESDVNKQSIDVEQGFQILTETCHTHLL